MISQIAGKLQAKELDRVEVMTDGGVAYECLIPLSVFESLPAVGERVSLNTHLSVREDAWHLYAFVSTFERAVFQKLLVAKGVGPALALGILSALSAERVVSAIREKDVQALMRAPRVGRKKAEQLVLDLADKLDALGVASAPGKPQPRASTATDDAVRALLSLGYTPAESERAVKLATEQGATGDVSTLVRAALSQIAGN